MSQSNDSYITFNKSDEEAQRLLSLAVMFENAKAPIASKTIRQAVYSYCKSDESARKAFMRDREKLVLCGLIIKKHDTDNGDAAWTLDEKSLPGELDLTGEEAATLSVACAPLVNDPSFPFANELRLALVKINNSFESRPPIKTNPLTRTIDSTRSKLEGCAAENHPARITYEKSDGTSTTRSIGVCGFFSMRGNTYVVAQRLDSNEQPHSYNLARVSTVSVIKSKTFAVPSDFDIRTYIKLPFQMGPTLYLASFYVPTSEKDELVAHSLGKGSLERESSDEYVWSVEVSNTQRAAAWAVAHAIQPLSPQELRDSWINLLEESASNGRK